MTELIAIIILISSLVGIVVILLRKIPILVELPEIAKKPSERSFRLKLKNKIKGLPAFKSFSFEIFLQKIISKIRIFSLKAENKTFNWLQKLREKAQKKNLGEDNYWQELKKSTNQVDEKKKRKRKIAPM